MLLFLRCCGQGLAHINTRARYLRACLILLLAPLLSPLLHASTVLQMDFEQILDTAELVFEGRVVSVNARESGPRLIHTVVEFEILDVLKGSYAGTIIELNYLGGRVGNRQMQVIDMHLPEAGETGIYFVESLSLQRAQVHPLVGWSQGHFLTRPEASGGMGLFTPERQAIRSVQALTRGPSPLPVPSAPALRNPAILGHGGVARGVALIPQSDRTTQAMSVSDFKALVRTLSETRSQP